MSIKRNLTNANLSLLTIPPSSCSSAAPLSLSSLTISVMLFPTSSWLLSPLFVIAPSSLLSTLASLRKKAK